LSDRKIYKGTLSLIVGTFGSRALGFVREMLAARLVGGGHEMDVFAVAFRIPNLVRGIFGEKASESAFLPIYKNLIAQDKKDEAEAVSADTLKILLLMLLVFCILAYLLAPWIVSLMGTGFKGISLVSGSDKFSEAVSMTRMLLPAILLIGFFTFLGARMLAHGRFFTYAVAPLVANILVIATILITYRYYGWYCLAWGVLAGALTECLFFWLLSDNRFSLFGKKIFSVALKNPNLKTAGKLWVPITFGSGIEKIGTVIETQIASFLGKGAVSALYYANLLNWLPFSILALSFNRAIIPFLTEHNAKKNHADFHDGIVLGIRLNCILLLPVTAFMMIMRVPIIELLFQYGKFDAEATRRTAAALFYYSAGLLAMGLMTLFSRAFYAFLNTKMPLLVSIFTLCLNIGLNLFFVYGMGFGGIYRHAGLALGASCSFWVNAIILFIMLNKKLESAGASLKRREITDLIWRTMLPMVVLIGAILYLRPLLVQVFPGETVLLRGVRLFSAGSAALIIYVSVGWICGIKEFRRKEKK
jgi:putative peptidoglycan lipid II flippase